MNVTERDSDLVANNTEDSHKSPNETIAAPPRRSSGFGRWILLALVLLIAASAVLISRRKAANSGANADQPTIPTIEVASATRGDIGMYIDALGTVTPQATINLYSQVTGRVVGVHYVEGQMVHRGDPLIDIDPRPYQAQLQQVEGTLEHDRLLLQQAQMDLKRYQEASGEQAIARQTYEDQKLLVDQYQATIKNDIGQVQYAQVQLDYCHLTSPIDGRVGLRLIDPGNTVFAGGSNPLVVVTQLRPITIVFDVAEDHLNEIGDEVTRRQMLPVDAFDRSLQHKIATGKLLTLDNLVDTSTGTVRFRAQFPNIDLKLFPNQFVNARLQVKTLHDVVLIPSAAVQRNGIKSFAYVLTGNTVKMHDITELTTEGPTSAVQGINTGDVVAITGFDKLQDGQQITVQRQPQAAKAPVESAR
ncbi:efflux RND transporter periplasmic adaptor subunit [Granulicella sp. WH15]|nr:efflux RND transporter periplasmic adaptor subunit [Granulicella sp. WH15]